MELEIREYTNDDWLSFMTFSTDKWNTTIKNIGYSMLKEYDGRVIKTLMAINGKDLVGFIYGFILPNNLLIPVFVYIKPEYRKKGIATKLLSELEKNSKCTASMIFYNKCLHDFYQTQGYKTGENIEVAMKNL